MIPAYPVLEKPLTPSYSYSAQEWEQIFAELSALLAHPEARIGESAIAKLIQALKITRSPQQLQAILTELATQVPNDPERFTVFCRQVQFLGKKSPYREIMLIYLAAPLFSLAEQQFNLTLAQSLRSQGFTVFLPQQECTGIPDTQKIYSTCLRGLQNAQVLVAILDGADADSGTCWECGYAVARNIPVIALRTDFRNSGDTQGFNAMLYHSATVTLEGSENLESRLVQAIQHLRAELE